MMGNPLIREEMQLQNLIKDIKMEKSRYNESVYEMQDKIRVKYPEEIKILEQMNKHSQHDFDDAKAAKQVTDEDGKQIYPIEVNGVTYSNRKDGGNAIKIALGEKIAQISEGHTVEIGRYRGMKLSVFQNSLTKRINACLAGIHNYYCDLNPETDIGNVVRLDNCINNIEAQIKKNSEEIAAKKADLEIMKSEVDKPFPRADELFKAETRLEEVHVELTQFELNDDSGEKDLYERLTDQFADILSGKTSSMEFSRDGLSVSAALNGDTFTLLKCSEENTFTAKMQIDYVNRKALLCAVNGEIIPADDPQNKKRALISMDKTLDKIEDLEFQSKEKAAERNNISR